MQLAQNDYTVVLALAALAIIISMFNTFLLWKKGAVGKNDIILLLKILTALLPQINNPVIRQLLNEFMHALMERMGLAGKHADVDLLLQKIEEIGKQTQPHPS